MVVVMVALVVVTVCAVQVRGLTAPSQQRGRPDSQGDGQAGIDRTRGEVGNVTRGVQSGPSDDRATRQSDSTTGSQHDRLTARRSDTAFPATCSAVEASRREQRLADR